MAEVANTTSQLPANDAVQQAVKSSGPQQVTEVASATPRPPNDEASQQAATAQQALEVANATPQPPGDEARQQAIAHCLAQGQYEDARALGWHHVPEAPAYPEYQQYAGYEQVYAQQYAGYGQPGYEQYQPYQQYGYSWPGWVQPAACAASAETMVAAQSPPQTLPPAERLASLLQR